MKNNEEREYFINTKYEFSRLTLTSVIDLESTQDFKKKFMQNNKGYVVNNGQKLLINLNKLIQDDKVAPEVITNFNEQVLHQNNFTDGIVVNEKFVNVLGKNMECIKNVNEFIKSDKLIYPNGKEKDLKLIFFDHAVSGPYDNVYMDFYSIKNVTEIHEAGCDFILLVDEVYYADNSIDDACVLFNANIPTKNMKKLLSSLSKFKAGAFKNISVDNNRVTFNISEPDKKKLWWIRKIPGWLPEFLESFIILSFGLNKKSIVIDDNEFLSMLKKHIEEDKDKDKDNDNEIKEKNRNKRRLFGEIRENGILKEHFISSKTDQKVSYLPKPKKHLNRDREE